MKTARICGGEITETWDGIDTFHPWTTVFLVVWDVIGLGIGRVHIYIRVSSRKSLLRVSLGGIESHLTSLVFLWRRRDFMTRLKAVLYKTRITSCNTGSCACPLPRSFSLDDSNATSVLLSFKSRSRKGLRVFLFVSFTKRPSSASASLALLTMVEINIYIPFQVFV